MSAEYIPSKRIRLKDSKCAKCKKFLRKAAKGTERQKIIASRTEAENFLSAYGFYVETDDIICHSCFTSLRMAKSRKEKSESEKSDLNKESDGLTANVENIRSIQATAISQKPSTSETPLQDEQNPVLSGSDIESQEKTSQVVIYDSGDRTNSQQSSESSASIYTEEIKTLPETVIMNFNRVVSSKAYCFICYSRKNLHDVPFEARMQVFVKKRIFIPIRNRCCEEHLIGKFFYEDELTQMKIYSNESAVEVPEIEKFLGQLSKDVDRRVIDKIEEMNMSNEKVKSLTGHVWADILELREMMTKMRDSANRNVLQALIIFLFKIRTGNSDLTIASIMEVTEKVVRDSVHSVLDCFENEILPSHFGVGAHSREFFLGEKAPIADLLQENTETRLKLICDGTYLRHEKSSNNAYQRKSYSGQKKTALCKPFTICTTNGYTVDAPGPFEGTMNDAEILRKVLEDPTGISSILEPGDEFVLDRGFRDVVKYLEAKGFRVLMPSLKGKEKQLTTKQANHSRFVTKLRWVVEAIHGIIGQKYRLLHHQFQNNMLKDAATYTKIAYFLLNKFGKRLNMETSKMDIIAARMKLKNVEINDLAEEIQEDNLNRKSLPFQSLTSTDLLDFPKLSLEDLEIIFTGSYQIKQAISYLGEMLDESGHLPLKFLRDRPGIIQFEVRSRHINAKTYKCYVKYDKNETGIEGIEGYCCNCANGLRTVGCCSHVASLIYHLSHGRYLSKVFRPAEILTNLFDADNVCPVIDEDSDED